MVPSPWGDQLHGGHAHGMQPALDFTLPEIEEAVQHREFRRDIKLLPHKALQ